MTNGSQQERMSADDITVGLKLAGNVVDVWTDPAAQFLLQDGAVRAAWPTLGQALDAMAKWAAK
jgi:hypothetical protein